MAELIDERQEEETEVAEVTEENLEAPEAAAAETSPEDDIPEKYRGKSAKELVRMHQEAERLNGRQGSEVGELRKTVDTFIQSQLQEPPQPEEEVDFFTDPELAVAKAVERHPDVIQAKKASKDMQENADQSALRRLHPDMDEILQDNGFGEWISASKVRAQMLNEAHTQYDHEKAAELFDLWKAQRQAVTQTVKAEEQARKQQVKQASTGNTRASAETASRKVYRRADIIKLMKEEPDRYAGMADEILAAYAEGRVK